MFIVSKVTPNTPLITALHMFAEKRVSALPVVNEKGKQDILKIIVTPTGPPVSKTEQGRMRPNDLVLTQEAQLKIYRECPTEEI